MTYSSCIDVKSYKRPLGSLYDYSDPVLVAHEAVRTPQDVAELRAKLPKYRIKGCRGRIS